ncbi:MAG: dihydrofolate reductase family protein [Bifidobacterium crudilactis]|jgi:dihydrofolate reductase|uniref:dihydrofolate reductase family protein n=1 Tax=Bifidobacterium crudilactis TaxID=327277 RepID=UPI003A5BB159
MTTHFYTASSLDGFIATKQDSLEWLFAQHFDQQRPMSYESFIDSIGALVMGRSTYQWLLKHQAAWEYSQPTWVFTHQQLPGIEGADIRLISGDVEASFADIQASAQGRDIWVMGGGDLAGQFADAGHLDELWIQFAPVTLGSGKALLSRELQLELLDASRNEDFVCAHYRVLGELGA